MSSNVLLVSALDQASFQLFAESVKTHSSSPQFCQQSVLHYICNDPGRLILGQFGRIYHLFIRSFIYCAGRKKSDCGLTGSDVPI